MHVVSFTGGPHRPQLGLCILVEMLRIHIQACPTYADVGAGADPDADTDTIREELIPSHRALRACGLDWILHACRDICARVEKQKKNQMKRA